MTSVINVRWEFSDFYWLYFSSWMKYDVYFLVGFINSKSVELVMSLNKTKTNSDKLMFHNNPSLAHFIIMCQNGFRLVATEKMGRFSW